MNYMYSLILRACDLKIREHNLIFNMLRSKGSRIMAGKSKAFQKTGRIVVP